MRAEKQIQEKKEMDGELIIKQMIKEHIHDMKGSFSSDHSIIFGIWCYS